MTSPTISAKPTIATTMKGRTLATISPPGRVGVHAKRAIVSPPAPVIALACSVLPGAAPPIMCRPGSARRCPISATMSSSRYLTETTIGAPSFPAASSASEPVATAATIAGRPRNRSIRAKWRPGSRGLSAPATATTPGGIAPRRERMSARTSASSRGRSAAGGSLAAAAGGYLIWSAPSTTTTRSWPKKVRSQVTRLRSTHCGS